MISNILWVQDPEVLREGCNVYRRSTTTVSFVELQCEWTIYLIEKHVLSVSTFCCEVFEISILTDSMLLTKLRPELGSNYVSVNKSRIRLGASDILLLPHWPAWIVIISLTLIQSHCSNSLLCLLPWHCCAR